MSEFLERMFRECGRDVKFTDVTIEHPTCPHCKQVVRANPFRVERWKRETLAALESKDTG